MLGSVNGLFSAKPLQNLEWFIRIAEEWRIYTTANSSIFGSRNGKPFTKLVKPYCELDPSGKNSEILNKIKVWYIKII